LSPTLSVEEKAIMLYGGVPSTSFVEAELEVDVGLVGAESGAEARNVSENRCVVEPFVFELDGKPSSKSVVEFASSR
jgi:hypothetical protein